MSHLRLVFMGSPDFAVPVLGALLDAGHEVAAVYCQPPRPAGRGQRERLQPVHAFARDKGLRVLTPASLKGADAAETFGAFAADAAVVAAYGLILPPAMLAVPRLGCLNVHASLLPRWRGAAPIQRAILAGDAETGITIMHMDEGLDTGPMLLAEPVPIQPATTAGELHDTLAALGARLAVEALTRLDAGDIAPTPQPAAGATLAPRLRRGEGRIDWHRPAAELERAVRALDPWPGAWFEHAGPGRDGGTRRIKVLAAEIAAPAAAAPAAAAPGTVLDDGPTVACGRGALRLIRLQRAGRAPADAAEFLRGYPLPAGSVLS